jgi:hypothetical protein
LIYLIIIVVVAAAGITRLWLVQRQHKQPMETVDGFWEGLERISSAPLAEFEMQVPSEPEPTRPSRRKKRPASASDSRARPPVRGSDLDPERRAAAKARLEARRRSQRLSAP